MNKTTVYLKTVKGWGSEMEVKAVRYIGDSVSFVTPNGRVYTTHISNVLVVEEPNDE